MILDIHDRVKVVYKKLNQMFHFEKHPLTLRWRMAEFECEADFEERLRVVAKVAEFKSPHDTPQFQKWIEAIDFDVIPKSAKNLSRYRNQYYPDPRAILHDIESTAVVEFLPALRSAELR